MIVRETRRVDSKGRVNLPIFIVKSLDLANKDVYFEITRNGYLMVKKVEKDEKKNVSPSEEDNSYNLLEEAKED